MTYITASEAAEIINEYGPSDNGRKWTEGQIRFMLEKDAFQPRIGCARFNQQWSFIIVKEWLLINLAETQRRYHESARALNAFLNTG